jgi:hypothetical protein
LAKNQKNLKGPVTQLNLREAGGLTIPQSTTSRRIQFRLRILENLHISGIFGENRFKHDRQACNIEIEKKSPQSGGKYGNSYLLPEFAECCLTNAPVF